MDGWVGYKDKANAYGNIIVSLIMDAAVEARFTDSPHFNRYAGDLILLSVSLSWLIIL